MSELDELAKIPGASDKGGNMDRLIDALEGNDFTAAEAELIAACPLVESIKGE